VLAHLLRVAPGFRESFPPKGDAALAEMGHVLLDVLRRNTADPAVAEHGSILLRNVTLGGWWMGAHALCWGRHACPVLRQARMSCIAAGTHVLYYGRRACPVLDGEHVQTWRWVPGEQCCP